MSSNLRDIARMMLATLIMMMSLDMVSTVIGVGLLGLPELNPYPRFILTNYGIWVYALLYIIYITLIVLLIKLTEIIISKVDMKLTFLVEIGFAVALITIYVPVVSGNILAILTRLFR